MNFFTAPELLTILLNVEALEDNEVLTIERTRYISRISDPKHKAYLDKLKRPQTVRKNETWQFTIHCRLTMQSVTRNQSLIRT